MNTILSSELQAFLAANTNPLGQLTLGEAVERYLAERTLRPLTVRTYRDCFASTFVHLSGVKLSALTRANIFDAFKAAPGKQVANLAVALVRATYNYYEVTPPLKRFPKNAITPRDRLIPRERLPDFWCAVAKMRPDTQLAATFLLGYGLRWSELASLKWSDMSDTQFIVRNTKNGRDLTLPVTSKLRAALPEPRSEFVCRRSLKKHSVVLLRRALGLEFSSHDLRRTFITVACELDVNAYMVKALANHAADDVTSTHYFRPSLKAKLAALETIQTVLLP